jgi:hypothetical protein
VDIHHLAVEFIWKPDGKRSEAFRFVLVMAAIAKVWKWREDRADLFGFLR